MKKCSKCNEEKSFSEFSKRKSSKDGLHPNCKSCVKQYREANKEKIKQYNEANKEKIAEYFKQYQEANKERLVEYGKQYREENKERLAELDKQYYEENKEKIAEYRKQYREENKERIAECKKQYNKQRKNTDPVFKFRCNVRSLISGSFKRGTNQFRKDAKTEQILGYTIEEFRLYIQSKFKEGMSFENYGEWHLDHITPIAIATTEEDIIKLNHYTNFQPLWAEDNLKKSNKINGTKLSKF